MSSGVFFLCQCHCGDKPDISRLGTTTPHLVEKRLQARASSFQAETKIVLLHNAIAPFCPPSNHQIFTEALKFFKSLDGGSEKNELKFSLLALVFFKALRKFYLVKMTLI